MQNAGEAERLDPNWILSVDGTRWRYGRVPYYVLSYDERMNGWFALRRTSTYAEFTSFAHGTFEDMRTLVEITIKLEP